MQRKELTAHWNPIEDRSLGWYLAVCEGNVARFTIFNYSALRLQVESAANLGGQAFGSSPP
jgi:hypothetical protein